MGGGVVLESGTHNELLSDVNGPYARLVAAQKLRDSREKHADGEEDASETAASGEGDIEKQAEEEVALGRTSTRHSRRSLASEALEQKKEKETIKKEYTLPYLFYRMGLINRSVWNKYIMGGIAAASECFFPFLSPVLWMCVDVY